MILKKIPEQAINKLGMNREVARPEGLIMKCVPIPPNCTRTTDYKYVNNTTAVQFGSVCTGILQFSTRVLKELRLLWRRCFVVWIVDWQSSEAISFIR